MNLTDCINILHNYFESPNYKIFSIKKNQENVYPCQFFGTSVSKLEHLLFKIFNDLFKGQDVDIILTSESNFYFF